MTLEPTLSDLNRSILRECRSYRTATSWATLRRALRAIPQIGVTRLADLTTFDTVGIPVASASRPAVTDHQVSAALGKGQTCIDALAAALMEAVERDAAEPKGHPVTSAAYGSAETAAPPKSQSIVSVGECGSGINLEWIEASSLFTNRKAWLPAAAVLFPYEPAADLGRPVVPNTTGLASGTDLREAILHGLMEVIERDAVSRYFLGVSAPALDLDSVGVASSLRLLECWRQSGARYFVIDLTQTAGIPTYKSFAIDERGLQSHLTVTGQGSHFVAHVALNRTLMEMAQARIAAIHGGREDLVRFRATWTSDFGAVREAYNRLERKAHAAGTIRFTSTELAATVETDVILESMAELVRRRSLTDAWVVGLTRQEVGIPVVRVVVPGMLDTRTQGQGLDVAY